ncbi:BTAD domain-containing putative transcriptional regulator [Nonomuraea sp. NPDC048882]|uniref:AfsR/SARP family transcriptional regulator n=1 Tax=Nonomuraea sp. NPDC048882 TaxID=3154347 RepID=UPI0033C2E92C
MRYQLLNGMQAFRDDRPVQLGERQQRLLLALLLLAEGKPVTIEQAIDKIWGEKPISSARPVLSQYASDLRGRLGRTPKGTLVLPTHTTGYLVVAERDQVDVHRFHDLVGAARPLLRKDDARAVELLRDGLRQWGGEGMRPGEPLSGLPGPGAANARTRLLEEHRAAVVECMEAELRLGRHTQVVPEVQDLVERRPLDEEATRLLMLALHRVGRSSDALAAGDELRRRLGHELGTDPSVRIRDLRQRILQQDPGLEPPADSPVIDSSGANMRSVAELGKDAAHLVAEAVTGGGTAHPEEQAGVSWAEVSWGRHSVQLLEMVRVRFAGDTAAASALAQVEADPVDPTALATLERVLVAHLGSDRAFLEGVERLVRRLSRAKDGSPSIVADTIKNASVYHAPVHFSGDFTIS